MISLLAGKPNSATFPLTSVAIKARSPADPSAETTAELTGAALAEGLQYGPTAGLPGLIGWIYGLQEREHGRKQGEGWRVSVGSGSQDVLHKVGRSLAVRPVVERSGADWLAPGDLSTGESWRAGASRETAICVSLM